MGLTTRSFGNLMATGLLALAAGTASAQVAFEVIPAVLPGDASWAFGVSSDGSWVCGRSGTNYYYGSSGHGYRWSRSTGVEDLDPLVGESTAYGISADGQNVVGYENAGSRGWRSFTWTPTTGMTHLYNNGMLMAASSNGAYCTGYETLSTGVTAVRCVMGDHHTSPLVLDSAGLTTSSQANASSTDGSVVVGTANFIGAGQRAFRWTEGTGVVNIGGPILSTASQGLGVSGDGSIVVGAKADAVLSYMSHAFRWTNAGMTLLTSDDSAFTYSTALGISADGTTIVGKSQSSYGSATHGFMWRANIGVQQLQTVLAAVLPVGAQILDATATSANGNVIVGSFRDPNNFYLIRSFTANVGDCIAPMIVSQPASSQVCRPHQNVMLNSPVGGFAPFTYSWQLADASAADGWRTVSDIAGHVSGSQSAALAISDATSADAGTYRCVITNNCGTTTSSAATVAVCISDFNCDSVADFNDYLDFVDALSSGAAIADFNSDSVIDFNDYLDFVDALSTGC